MSLKDKLAKHKEGKAKSAAPKSKVENITELFSNDNVDEIINEAKKENRFFSKAAGMFYPDPNQPRKTFEKDSLVQLQKDIESIGQLQPILVKPQNKKGKYEIIAGERRWRAIKSSRKVKNVDAVIVKTEFDELLILRMQIQENDNREYVNAIENSAAILRGIELCKNQDPDIDDIKASELLGVSRSKISKSRALLSAPDKIKSLSEQGIINDYNALYDLSVCHKKNADQTETFIDNIVKSDEKINFRNEIKTLVNNINTQESNEAKRKKAKITGKTGSKLTRNKENAVQKISFESKNNKEYMNLTIGNKRLTYLLTNEALGEISRFGKEAEAVS